MIHLSKFSKLAVSNLIQSCNKYNVIRSFHPSSIVMKRHGGESDYKPVAREFSKKQQKRNKKLMIRRKEQVDQTKKKMEKIQTQKQAESPALEKYGENLQDMFSKSLGEIMAPEGILQGGLGEGERVHRQIVNPDLVLVLLQEKYRIQQGVELEEISGPATPQLSPYTSVVAKMLSVVNVDEARKRNLSVAMKRFDEGLEELGLSGKLDSRAVGDTAMYFARGGRFEKMREVFELGKELQMIPTIDIFVQCMSAASASKNYTLAEQIFDDLKTYDLVPNEFAWRALIHAKACSKGADEGLALLKRIETMGVKIIIGMYNAVLSVMVDQKMYSRADELWIEMHSIPDTKLDLASFKIYTKALKYHGRVERAMFCYNELKALGLEPDQDYFATLFRTCAEAPFWVNGYQNTLIDVMRNMESNEILPNIEIYNAVIYGFGRACDAKAAEFYFWEMKRKGIQPDATTYNSFLNALAREQLVGRRVAGTLGRWTRPPQRLNREQLAALKLGPNKMAELMVADAVADSHTDLPGRHSITVDSLYDDEDEADEEFSQTVLREAAAMKGNHLDEADKAEEEDDENDLFEDEPRMKKLSGKNMKFDDYGYEDDGEEEEEEENEDTFIEREAELIRRQEKVIARLKKDEKLMPVGGVNRLKSKSSENLLTSKSTSQLTQSSKNLAITDNNSSSVTGTSTPSVNDFTDEETEEQLQKLLAQDPELEKMFHRFKKMKEDEDSASSYSEGDSEESLEGDEDESAPARSGRSRRNRLGSKTKPRSSRQLAVDKLLRQDDDIEDMSDEQLMKVIEEISDSTGDSPIESEVSSESSIESQTTLNSNLESDSLSVPTVEDVSQVESSGRRMRGRKPPPRRIARRTSADMPTSTPEQRVNIDIKSNASKKVSSKAIEMESEKAVSVEEPAFVSKFSKFDSDMVPFAEVNIEKFEDPFKHIRSQQFDGDDQQLTPTAKNLVNVLDSNQGAYDNIQDKVMNAIKGANSPKDIKKMLQLGAGPGKEISSIDDVQNMFSGLGDVDINSMWAMVEFGRCPDADYSTPIPVRVRENIKKANYILADMRAQGIEPDAYTFTSYLTVYANGGYDKDALQIFKDTFNENTGLQPHYRTYRSLIQMSLRKKNLNQAIELKNEMIRAGIQPDSEIHGIFIETYAQRKMVVEGLKELEEATVKGLKIPERLIRHLRSQCRNMQVKHPDMPADPKEWVRDIKKSRRDLRNVSKRDIQQLKSLYTKVA